MNRRRTTAAGSRRPVWAALAGLLLAACPGKHDLRPAGPRFETAEQLLQAMRSQRLQALRVEGTVDMRRGDKRVKAHMLYLTRRPAWLRFETESFFDQPLSILVTDGMRFSAWDMKNGRFVRGSATPAHIARIIPVPLDGSEVAGVLMGDPPWIPYARARLDWDAERRLYRIEFTTARARQVALIEPRLLRPLEVELRRGDRRVYQLQYEDWIERQGRAVAPRKIRFEMPADEIRLRIKIRRAQADPALADDLFELEPPAGVVIERWP